jgi:hypothetical protein
MMWPPSHRKETFKTGKNSWQSFFRLGFNKSFKVTSSSVMIWLFRHHVIKRVELPGVDYAGLRARQEPTDRRIYPIGVLTRNRGKKENSMSPEFLGFRD